MPTCIVLAFVLDALTTLAALRLGGAEANPLVAGLGLAAYVVAVVLRCVLALTLLALARDPRPGARRLVVGGLAGVVTIKLVAATSNLALAACGAALVTPAEAPALAALGLAVAVVAGGAAGSKDHDPRPAEGARIS